MFQVIINFIVPIIMIILGVVNKLVKFEYPANGMMSGQGGYKSKQSISSKEKWDYAQIISSKYLLIYGVIAFAFELICNVLIIVAKPDLKGLDSIVGMLSIIFVFMAIYKIENSIALKFNK